MNRGLTTILSLLGIALTATAQPRLSSNEETHRFGQIEWNIPVTVEYTITNTGNKPLVLTDVTTSCACSVAEWTKTPIDPGKKGVVRATFDARALGHFDKSVSIYSNAIPHLTHLRFTGEVTREVTDFSRLLPYTIGQIRLDREDLDFPDTYRGKPSTLTFGVANLSERPYEPVLMHLPPYLTLEAVPKVLQQGQRGTVKLTLNPDLLQDYGLTQTSVYLSRFAGDKVSPDNELPLSVVLLPDFSNLTPQEKRNAPVIALSEQTINLRQALAKKERARRDITITNVGQSPLVISKLQVFNPAVSVSLKKATLPPSTSTKLQVTIHKTHANDHKGHLRVLMITNDPRQPKVEINIER
ncbi:MAG: DUF1573 domain-containing protein [Mediterranea sp.]|jgi:hypothetical protein|nr:DUF1573 domain-containing protein [Mediterranea sp.]